MDPIDIVNRLAAAGIQLQLRDGKLTTKARSGAITGELSELIKSAKHALVDFLLERAQLSASGMPPVTAAAPAERATLSHAQRRLWLVDRLSGGTAAYNMPVALRIDGQLDRQALARAFAAIVQRHEVLRTVYVDHGGEPRARVLGDAQIAVPEFDLTQLQGPVQQQAMQQHLAEASHRCFDLASEPMLCVLLLRLADTRWVLLVNLHHIAGDGWSMGVLVQEFVQLYRAFAAGTAHELPPLTIQYADYAVWQRTQLGPAIAQQLDYWRTQLSDAPLQHGVPTDFVRPAVLRNHGAVHAVPVPRELSQQLNSFCRQRGVTPFMALQLVFAILLARWSHCDDIVLGTPIAGRVRPELENLIGLFVNTLVLRNRIDTTQSFTTALAAAARMTTAAYQNQDVQFDTVVDLLSPQRSGGTAPLVQIMFAMQNTAAVKVQLAGLTLASVELPYATAKVDLTLSVAENDAGFFTSWEFNTELFAAPTIERMAGQFVTLLASCIAQPEARLAELDLLTQEERRTLLVAWNDTRRDSPPGSLARLFDAQAQREPQRTALMQDGQHMSYEQLRRRSDQLASVLVAQGLRYEEPVGIYLERGADMIVAMLAILKAGGCYVPLDRSVPRERLELIVADGGLRVVISHGTLRATAAALAPAMLWMDALPAVPSVLLPGLDAEPRSLAYIMYTSGSTGTPKGVMIEQRGIVRLVCNASYLELSAADVIAQASNSAFDAASFEIWAALLNGAALTFIDADTLLDPPCLQRRLELDGVSVMWMTTSLFNQTVRVQPDIFARLRAVLFGGEAADPEAVRRVLAAGRPQQLINIYGPTENTSFTTWFEVPAVLESGCPIGRPISNTTCYVLGRAHELVPLGAVGELYTGGDGVARGYLQRAELTREKFVPNPFGAGTLYRTGDVVRWLPDGNLQFLGRSDDQVKIRGFRIELAEVELALGATGEVKEVAVLALPDGRGSKQLVAYVTLAADRDAVQAARSLKQQLALRLPPYMVPASICVLAAMPINANGKLDRQRLPAPDFGSAEAESGEEPRGRIEVALAGIWCEVLGLQRLTASANFFESGGNSLLLMRLSARIRELLGIEVAVSELFSCATLSQQAQLIKGRAPELVSAGPIQPQPLADSYPLSFAQQRLWFEAQLGNTMGYHLPLALTLDGELDEDALAAALCDVVAAHDILRTRYESRAGVGCQCIAPPQSWSPQRLDLSHASEPREALLADLERQAAAPFDLRTGPVFQAVLYRLSARTRCLLLRMHHIVSDGWSMQVLLEQVSRQYTLRVSGASPPPPRPAVQYTDFASWQRAQENAESMAASLDAWVERLAFVKELPLLPVDGERYFADRYPLGTRAFELDAETAVWLRRLAVASDCSLFMVLLACLSLVLARHSQQRRLVIGTDYAGRDLPQTQELIGLFVNQLAIVAAVDGAQSFSDFLRSVRANTLFAYQHQHVPVDRIVARLGLPRRPTQHPLFQTKLVLQNFRSTDAAAFQALKVGHVPLATQHSKIDLMLTLTESAGAMPAQWEYNSTYLHAGTIAQLQDEFLELLQLLRSVDHAMPLAELERRLDYKQAERIAELRARARPALRGGRRTTLNLA